MKAVFPGKPQAKLHAVSTCRWVGRRLVAYISGSSLLVLGGPNELLQTISHGDNVALTAVAIHDVSGKIATSTATTVYLYKPFGQDEGAVEWSLQHTYKIIRGDSSISCLSWGASEELLVGGTYLTLLSTDQRPRESWSRPLANDAKYAALCPDGSIIATTGWHDKLVKVWRRSWFGEDDERFDISYLPHPAMVTGMRWHARQGLEHHTEAILYTTCADNKLRVWAHTDPHAVQTLQIWAEIDLIPCLESDSGRRYVIIVDSWEFEALVENAGQQNGHDEAIIKSMKNLTDIAYRNPDICLVLDDRGNMSAWGLERVGCKARPAEDFFNIAYGGKLDIRFVRDTVAAEDHLVSYSFGGNELNVLLNFFDGRLEWMSCPIGQVFDQSAKPNGFRVDAVLTGHADPVDKIISSETDSAIISLSSNGEVIQWEQNDNDSAAVLIRSSHARVDLSVSHLLFSGLGAALLHQNFVSMWSFEDPVAKELVRCEFEPSGEVLTLFELPQPDSAPADSVYIGILTTIGKAIVWEILYTSDGQFHSQEQVHAGQVDLGENIHDISLQPQQEHCIAHPFAIVAAKSGNLTALKMTLNLVDKKLEWFEISQVNTNVENPSIISTGVNHKVAVVDFTRTVLTIWDSKDGHLEFTEKFESHEDIQLVKWMVDNSGNQSYMVVLPHKVLVYGQCRYDFSSRTAAWKRLQSVDVSLVSNLYIADCAWLKNGDILVAAGNQMFSYGNEIEVPRGILEDISLPPKAMNEQRHTKVVDALCSELPVFHPTFLAHCMAAGKVDMVHRILLTLHKELKFFTEGDDLRSDLGLNLLEPDNTIYDSDEKMIKNHMFLDSEGGEESTMTEETAAALNAKLHETRLPFLNSEEQSSLIVFVEVVGFTERHQRSADNFGIRYLSFLQYRALQQGQVTDVVAPLSWREIVWAFHSNTQDILVDLTSRQYQGKMLWTDARDCGMFMWMTDITALRAQFEVIARNEYSKTEARNPIDCSLHYLALRKKTVLVGLWRMATWNREQSATQRLLTNNFEDPRWKTAALKNAYALLGRRRFEYAAAFFLLADHLKDAVSVLATQLGDIQLAITVARVYEGDDGPVVKFLIEEKILPLAVREGNLWLAHWAFSMLKRMEAAMRSLITPLAALIPNTTTSPPPQKSHSFLNADPASLSLYDNLRDSPQQGSLQKYPSRAVNLAEEWDAIIRTARSYSRAGCGILALDAVRTHTFPPPAPPSPKINGSSHITSTSTSTKANPKPNGAPSANHDSNSIDEHDNDNNNDSEQKQEQDVHTNTDGELDDDGKATPEPPRPAEMKMGLLDGAATRKKVVEEPSAASIFDSFDF